MASNDRKPQVNFESNAPKVKPMKMGPVNTEKVVPEKKTGSNRKPMMMPKE